MDRLDAMRTFLAVADLGSFAGAARKLRLSSAAATRAVALIEEDLGTPVLSRTTRSVRLTERGAVYAERCRRVLAEVDEARSQARGEDAEPRGMLSVTAPVMFGRLHVLPLAEALLAKHPALNVRLTFVDRVTHLVEEGFDLAVRIGTLGDSALVAVPLTEVRRVLVASPDYLRSQGAPAAPADLKAHRIVAFEGVGSTHDWRFGGAKPTGVSVQPRLSVNSADAAIACVLRGGGITRVLSYQVEGELATGRLRRLLQPYEPAPIPVSLLYQASRRGSPNISAFVMLARERFGRVNVP
jgi:DNA-binding transcriptional LysR family regulator